MTTTQTWTIRPHESKSIIDGKPYVSWFEVTDGTREFIAFELPDAEWLRDVLESAEYNKQLTDVSL